jgi:hypothetical protein
MFGVRPGATFAEWSMPAAVGAARGDGKVPRRTATMKAHLVFLYCAVNRGPSMHVRVRSKRIRSRYVSGRTGAWLTKNPNFERA